MRGAAIGVMALLAGCLTPLPHDAPGEEPDEAAPEFLPIRFDHCVHQLAFVGVPEDDAAARLPDGFRPVLLAADLAQLVVHATTCESVDNTTGGMHEMLFALGVVPPADLVRDDVEFHVFYTYLVTDNASAWLRYSAWDVPGETGPVTIDVTTGGAGTGTSMAAGVRFTTVVAGMPSDGPAGAVRIFTEGAGVLSAVDYDFTPYHLVPGGATLDDPAGVSGFTVLQAVGYGVHEWGEGYGLILTRSRF